MNINKIAEFAYELREEKCIETHFNVCNNMVTQVLNESIKDEYDYDTAVTLVVMCINKCLCEVTTSIDKQSDSFYSDIDNVVNTLKNKLNKFITEDLCSDTRSLHDEFIDYANYLNEIIFKSFTIHERNFKEADYKRGYDQWNRCEQIFDSMIEIIPEYPFRKGVNPEAERFTSRYKIQIPYYYCHVFDYANYLEPNGINTIDVDDWVEKIDIDFTGNFVKDWAKRFYLFRGKSKTLNSYFYFEKPIVSYNSVDRIIEEAPALYFDCQKDEIKSKYHEVDFTRFLPSISGERRAMPSDYYEDDIKCETVEKDWYRSIPLLPYYAYNDEITKNIFDYSRKEYNDFIKKSYLNIENKKKLIEEKQKNIDYKTKVLARHAHDWTHIVYPSIIQEIAMELKAKGDITSANKLFSVYDSEQTLKLDLDLLKYEFKDSEEKVADFKSSVLRDYSRNPLVRDIMLNALELVLFRMIMVEDIEEIQIKKEEAYDIPVLKEAYISDILSLDKKSKRSFSLEDWVSRNLFKFEVVFDSIDWKENIKFLKDDIAYTQMLMIFINLFTNVVNYASKGKENVVKLVFGEEKVDNTEYLTITQCNDIERSTSFYKSRKVGLKNVKETILTLNQFDNTDEPKSLDVEKDKYCVKIWLRKKLFEKN